MPSKEFETNMTFSETCLWIESLAEGAESTEELEGLTATFREQLDWFLSESSMPVPPLSFALRRRGSLLTGCAGFPKGPAWERGRTA
jgi:hypothetical protein